MAVIHTTRRSGASLRDQFKYGGCYKHEGYEALGQVVNVDAHKGKDLAIKEGWGLHWQGNDAADQTAKTVRQKLVGNEKLQQRAVANLGKTKAGRNPMSAAWRNVEAHVRAQEDIFARCQNGTAWDCAAHGCLP